MDGASCWRLLMWAVLCLVEVLLNELHVVQGATLTDGCHSTVWDDAVPEKGVYVVSGRCNEGRVEWRHPYGAVRLSLQLPPPANKSSSSSFFSTHYAETCFIVKSHLTVVKISQEKETTLDSVELYQKHPKDISRDSPFHSEDRMTELVLLNRSVSTMDRALCITSSGSSPLVLYMESQTDQQSATSGHVQLDYDIRWISTRSGVYSDDVMADCRPCSDEELITIVCSADYVVRASVDTILHNHETLQSHVRLRVKKIHRQRHPIFKRSTTSWTNDHERPSTNQGSIIAPHKCGIKMGSGQFMFMGMMRLKSALFQCAPRAEYFDELWTAATELGVNPCKLD